MAGALGAGIWGAIPGLLKAWTGAHEVINTIMMNWMAFRITEYLLREPLEKIQGTHRTPDILPTAELPRFFPHPLRLHAGLLMWTELRGIALVTGPSGVGKSITVRRFLAALDDARFHVIKLPHLPTTPVGLLRSLSRALHLPMRQYAADLFDAAQAHLAAHQDDQFFQWGCRGDINVGFQAPRGVLHF